MPTARAPLILAIWPTAEPTAPTGGGDHHRLSRRGLADRQKAGIGRETRHSQHSKRRAGRRKRGIELAQIRTIGNRKTLPAGIGADDLSLTETRMTRSDHPSHGSTFHDIPNFHRLLHRILPRSCAHAYRDQVRDRGSQAEPDRHQVCATATVSNRKSEILGSPFGRVANTIRRFFQARHISFQTIGYEHSRYITPERLEINICGGFSPAGQNNAVARLRRKQAPGRKKPAAEAAGCRTVLS